MQTHAYSASFAQMVHPFPPVFQPWLDLQGEVTFSFFKADQNFRLRQTGRQEAKNAGAEAFLCRHRQGEFIHYSLFAIPIGITRYLPLTCARH